MDTLHRETHKPKEVHQILAHSYSTYFIFFLIGLVGDIFFPYRVGIEYSVYIGYILIFIATILVLWAQRTSSLLAEKKEKQSHHDFRQGPYRFTRSPTHIGLGLLLLGVGFIFQSILIIILTAIPLLLAHFVFVRKMEEILENKYGEKYFKYKEIVKKKL